MEDRFKLIVVVWVSLLAIGVIGFIVPQPKIPFIATRGRAWFFTGAAALSIFPLGLLLGRGSDPAAASAAAARPDWASKPILQVHAQVKKPEEVEFTVITNLPPPLKVMATISLRGQEHDRSAIGTEREETLIGPSTTFVVPAIDDVNAFDGKILPSGSYEAGVTLGPQWPENQHVAMLGKNLEAEENITLKSGRSAADVERKQNLQAWVMENVFVDSPWNERRYVAKLGPFTRGPSTLSRLHDALYFPRADVTFIVNRLLGQVSVWRMGKATQ